MKKEGGCFTIDPAQTRSRSRGRARNKMLNQSVLFIKAQTALAHSTHNNPFSELSGTAPKLIDTNSTAYASITSNSTVAPINSLVLTDLQTPQYNATVISKINKVEFTKPIYPYLTNIKQNSDYLQVEVIEKGVNITVSGRQ